MKRTVFLLLSCLALANAKVDIKIANDKSAVIYLGKELASIRDMLEIYAQIAVKITYKLPKERLLKSLKELDAILDTLDRKYADDTLVTSSTKNARKSWEPVKDIMQKALLENTDGDVLRKQVVYIHDHIRGTIQSISKIKTHIIKISSIDHIAEINAALEVGASSKRLSAHYMMKLLDVDDPTIEKHYRRGLERYEEALQILKKSSPSQKTLDTLTIFEKRLEYFRTIWGMDIFTPVLVVKKANKVFSESIELADSY